MRSTFNVDDELLAQAAEYTGIQEKTKLVNLGLKSLVRHEAALRLAKLGGGAPTLTVASRRSRIEKKEQ